MPQNKVIIFDTTLRDGEQTPHASLNLIEKIEIARALEKLGVDVIEAGFPISSPGDFLSVQKVSKEIKDSIVCGLTRAVKKDIDVAYDALKDAKRPRIHTGIGASDIHIQHKFKSTRENILSRGVEAVKYAKKYVEDVEFYAEDAGRADPVFLAQMIQEVISAGATTVNIPDTTGYKYPEEFAELIRYLMEHVDNIHKAIISVHCHNDLGLATANTLAGIRAGARQAEVTINGIGERAGNTSLEEIVMALYTRSKGKIITGINPEYIYKTSRLVSNLMGVPVQPNKAIVGANAFAHSSGIHQDGVIKERETYEIIDPKVVGVDSSKIVLSARSGRSALAHRLGELGYHLEKPEVDQAYEQFLMLADRKKEVFDEDLHLLMSDVRKEHDERAEFVSLQVLSGNSLIPMATVTVKFDGEEKISSIVGTGPVDATYKAIDSIIQKDVVLLDYLVQAVTEGIDAQATVSVSIQDGDKKYYGFGSDTDIVVASAKAYIDALNKSF